MTLHIAHFIDTNVMGGAEKLIVDLAENSLKRGHKVSLLHFDHDTLAGLVGELGIKSIIVPNEPLFKSVKTLPLFALKFRAFLKKQDIDVVHSHLFGPVVATGLATGFFSKIKNIGTLHDSYTLEERPARTRLLQPCAYLGTKIVTVSDSIKDFVERSVSMPRNSLIRVHNGTPIPELPEISKVKEIRDSLGLREDDYVASCVGRLVPVKAHKVLLGAWAKLKSKDNKKLLIVGTGAEEEPLKSQAKELGIEDSVIFLGFRKDVSDILFASNTFVLASESEGLSCSIMEALAHALSVVVTDVGGNSELVRENENGFLTTPACSEALGIAIDKIASSSELQAQFSKKSRQLAEELFSLEKMLDKYDSLYLGT